MNKIDEIIDLLKDLNDDDLEFIAENLPAKISINIIYYFSKNLEYRLRMDLIY